MPNEITHTLRLPADLRDRLLVHLIGAAPNEGVGLLAVTGQNGIVEATAWFPGQNVDTSPVRFTMHPGEVLAALETIEREGWRLGAIVHSHLRGPATPSRTDLEESRYPDALMVIASLAQLPPDLRAWCPDPGDEGLVMRPVTIEIVP